LENGYLLKVLRVTMFILEVLHTVSSYINLLDPP